MAQYGGYGRRGSSSPHGQRVRHEDLYTKKKKRKKWPIVLLVLLVLIGLLCGAFAYQFQKYYKLSNYVSDRQVLREVVQHEAEEGIAVLANADLTEESSNVLSAVSGIYNLLLVGVDRRDSSWSGNADSIILVSVNRNTHTIHMISFMRDLYAEIPGYGVQKLNAACALGGCPLLVKTIEQNYQVTADNYVSLDYAGMIALIDAIGGVQIEVSDEEAELANGLITDMASFLGDSPDGHYFSGGGTCLCDGYQATAYSRIRFVGNSDYERTERQRTIMMKICEKIRNMSLEELGAFAAKVLPEVTHNIDAVTMLLLLPQIPSITGYDIVESRVPYDGLYTGQDEILVPDMDETIRRLQETIYGSGE